MPDTVWDHLNDVELIVTHMCPVNREISRRATRLHMIGVLDASSPSMTVDVDKYPISIMIFICKSA